MERYDFINPDTNKNFILNVPAEMPGGFFIYRAVGDGEILYANKALLDIFECDTYEEFIDLTGGVYDGLIHPYDLEGVKKRIQDHFLADDEHFDHLHYRIVTRNGREVYLEDYGRYVEDPEVGPIFYVFVTTSRMRMDGLTGLQSDWYFLDVAARGLDRSYRSGKRPVILGFDLIGMKGFNSKYGRNAGDELLMEFAVLLTDIFGNNHCSRFGEDHFYAYADGNDIENTINEFIVSLHETNEGRTLPVRIGICKYIPGVSISTLCDWAKVACDSKKNFYGSGYAWFDDDMARNFEKREYILSYLDRAISDGSIKVYYQPVVRALTGRLCSFEALVRWDDKRYGMISPAEFIPLLEENRLSYKIDRYVVNKVADVIQSDMNNGREIIPVSVNISRSDFDVIDPVDMVLKAADERKIPRETICIEITETAITSDHGFIKSAVDRFHSAGFKVWMDDFGSGYSSLNVLKDYNFDEIKIDMIFMRNFDDRAKAIVRLAVQMAKELGIHTLAEGVESEEHIEFLREIGCEKIQGYYYGRPMPLDDALGNISSQMIEAETREQNLFYDAVGLIELAEDNPSALYFYDGSTFTLIYQNDKYKSITTDGGNLGDDVMSDKMNSVSSGMNSKYRRLAELAIESGETEEMTYVDRNDYYFFSFAKLVSGREGAMLMAQVRRTECAEITRLEGLDGAVRNIMTMFDAIYLIDFANDSRTVIYSTLSEENAGDEELGIDDFYRRYNRREIYGDDKDRFYNNFANRESLMQRMNESCSGSFSEEFRIKDSAGNYVWTEFDIVSMPESEGTRYLICVRPAYIEGQSDKLTAVSRLVESMNYRYTTDEQRSHEDVWRSLMSESGLKLFWKDTDRRFLGASKSFLEYYGLASEKDIIGKTDEEIGWHINDMSFMEIEKSILTRGKSYMNMQGENMVRGRLRSIMASKFPVYREGLIAGIVGYFIDVDDDIGIESSLGQISITDELTGLMNMRGMMISVLRFDENYRANGDDYMYVTIDISEYDSIVKEQGSDAADEVIRRIAGILKSEFESSVALARSVGGRFSICMRGYSQKEMLDIINLCQAKVADILFINGMKTSLTMSYGFSWGSEYDDMRDVVTSALNRLHENKSNLSKSMKLEKMRESLNVFDELPLPFAIVQPYYGEDDSLDEPIDMLCCYVNRKCCDFSGYNPGELMGRRYTEIYSNTNKKWIDYANRAARGEVIADSAYSVAINGMVEFVAAPSTIPGNAVFVFKAINVFGDEKLSQEMEINTLKTAVGIWLRVEHEIAYRDAIDMALLELGELMDADRAYMIEFWNHECDVTHEWIRDDMITPMDGDVCVPPEIYQPYAEEHIDDGIVQVYDVHELRERYNELYNTMRSAGIYNNISAVLYLAGEPAGLLCVDNYNRATENNLEYLMRLFSKFISAKIIKKEIYGVNSSEEESMSLPKSITSKRNMAENIARQVAKILDAGTDHSAAVMESLELLMSEVPCDRIYLLEVNKNTVNNTYELCAEGVVPQHDTLQNMDYDTYFKAWEKMLRDDEMVIIENIEILRMTSRPAYVSLARQEIDRLMAAPFYYKGKLMGYLCVDNYDRDRYQRSKAILQAVSYIIGAKVTSDYFQRINSFDELTGVHNRNAMLSKKDEIQHMDSSIGIVFADMNGLKRVNDEMGHEEGDKFIQSTANILMDIYDKENIFRSGGDEFMVLLPGITESRFEALRQELTRRLDEDGVPEVAVGFSWTETMDDIDSTITEADRLMYHDKALFYMIHDRYRK